MCTMNQRYILTYLGPYRAQSYCKRETTQKIPDGTPRNLDEKQIETTFLLQEGVIVLDAVPGAMSREWA